MSLFSRRSLGIVNFLAATAMLTGAASTFAQAQAPFNAKALQQARIGDLPTGKWDMKATMLEIQPGGEVPFHTHKGPGLRYVVEGAITINWKEGNTQTYTAGSTYFEGSGANHPAGNFAARNDGTTVCRVVIIELVPQD